MVVFQSMDKPKSKVNAAGVYTKPAKGKQFVPQPKAIAKKTSSYL